MNNLHTEHSHRQDPRPRAGWPRRPEARHWPALWIAAWLLAACGGGEPGGNTNDQNTVAAGPAVVDTGYITVTDGTRLRYHLQRLDGAPPGPVLLQYDGYDAGTGGYFSDIPEVKAQLLQKGYAILGVSLRGTGCSGGGFNLFDPQQAVDGAEAVEWAADQPWSNGDVGMMGYSYPGVMQLFTAAQRPPSLRAIAPSNVFLDLYRDVGSPGGIPNGAFTALFTAQQQAPGVLGLPDAIAQEDPECLANFLANRLAYQSFLVDGLQSPYIDGDFGWLERSPASTAAMIDVPALHINFWQDEQTGSRIGGVLEPGGLLDVLGLDQTWTVMSNGNHDLTWGHPLHSELLVQFFEHYLRGVDNGWERTPRIQILHELSATDVQPSWSTHHEAIPVVEPTTLYLRAGGLLSTDAPQTLEAPGSYFYPLPSVATNPLPDAVGILDQLWRVPAPAAGRVVYTTPALEQDVQVMGSASLDLWLSSTASDTDIQATLTEVRPDGQEVYVARGWLRASQRALDEQRSTPTRPFQLHTEASAAPLTPEEPTFMRLEIFPFAHRFRADSALRVIIDGPAATTGDWGGMLHPVPAENTVLNDPDHPSRLVLGRIADRVARPPARPCGELANQPCRDSIAPVPSGRLTLAD